jgi:hypothetical protein
LDATAAMSAGGVDQARARRQVLRGFVLALCLASALILLGLLISTSAHAAGVSRTVSATAGYGKVAPATTTWGAILPWRSLAIA